MRMEMLMVFVVHLLCVSAVQEYQPHGVHHADIHAPHYTDGEHNDKFDHEAILGSDEAEEEFAQLPPHEAKKRLATMVDSMDADKNGFVSREELHAWISNSFVKMNLDDAKSKLEEEDSDKDYQISWPEYLKNGMGYTTEEIAEMEKSTDPEVQITVRMVQDDQMKFNDADQNKDGYLDLAEYSAFMHPLDYPHMQELELTKIITQYDKNNNGAVDWAEYQGDSPGSEESQIVDKENFASYDKNEDGKLERDEVRAWMIPDNVSEEVEHMFQNTDLDHDDKLSKLEIVDQHELWVGSLATDFGDSLHHHDPQEL